MSRFRALFLAAFVLPVTARSDQRESWPEGSAMGVGEKHVASRAYFGNLVEKRQTTLIQLLETTSDERVVDAVRALHGSWLQYFPQECELVGSLSGAGGSWPSTYAVRCQANLMYRRYRRLGYVIACIERARSDNPVTTHWATNTCLYQLSPLTYGKES